MKTAIATRTILPVFTLKSASYDLRVLNQTHIADMLLLQDQGGDGNIIVRDGAYYEDHFDSGKSAIGMFAPDGTLAAHALIHTNGTTTLLQNVVTHPGHRGCGLMPKLVAHWLETSAAAGYSMAETRVRPTAPVSLKRFIEAGLQITETKPSPEDPSKLVHVLQMPLQQHKMAYAD